MKKVLEKHSAKISREVTEKDLKVVKDDSKDLLRTCLEPIGIHKGAYAMAHPQIEEEDPLRYFVMRSGYGYINPVIVKQCQPYKMIEGCMSFPTKPCKRVDRFNLIVVKYVPFIVGREIDLNNVVEVKFSGLEAAIFQHEIGHFDLNLIYPLLDEGE